MYLCSRPRGTLQPDSFAIGIHDVSALRPEWHRWHDRRRSIGASAAAVAAAGVAALAAGACAIAAAITLYTY